jgi:hypothetical protein
MVAVYEKELGQGEKGYLHYIHFDVGIGSRTWFWYDMWCGKTPLREVFPTLYECSIARYALVESILVRRSEGDLQSWDVNFLRDFND